MLSNLCPAISACLLRKEGRSVGGVQPQRETTFFATRGGTKDDETSGQCTSHLLHPTSSPRTRGDAVVANCRRLRALSGIIVLWLPPYLNSKSHIQIQCNLLFSSNNLKFEVNRRTVSTNWLDGFSPFALNLRHDTNPGAPRPPQGPRATPAYATAACAKAACATPACATPACAMPATPPSSRRMSYPHA